MSNERDARRLDTDSSLGHSSFFRHSSLVFRHWFRLAIFPACVLVSSFANAAPPKLTSIFPAGAQRGQTATVTASGSFERWPVKTWVDGPGIEVAAADEKGKLSVSVAADALPGVHWIRLYDEEGATSPRPFIIGTLPELLEAEPNDDPRKPQLLESSAVVVNGRLEKNGDVDSFAVQLRKGQTLVASMEANRTLGSAMDASLQIVSGDGFVVDQNDDYHDLDPQIVFTAPTDGRFLVRTFAFPVTPDSSIRFTGNAEFIYRLTITTNGFVEYAHPLAMSMTGGFAGGPGPTVGLRGWNLPDLAEQKAVAVFHTSATPPTAFAFHRDAAGVANFQLVPHATDVDQEPNDREHAQEISLPTTITGRVAPARDADWFRFAAKKGEKLAFRVESRGLGFPLDPFLRLTDATGKTISEIDDSAGGRDAELNLDVPADGEYRLLVRDLHGHGGERFVYRLTATPVVPDFNLKVASDSFVLTPGKPLEIPVTIERNNGFAGEIEIVATGLPDGVSATPVKSLAQGDSAKSVKLTITSATGPHSSPIRIAGTVAGERPVSRAAAAAIAGLTAGTTDLWLTVLTPPQPKQ